MATRNRAHRRKAIEQGTLCPICLVQPATILEWWLVKLCVECHNVVQYAIRTCERGQFHESD